MFNNLRIEAETSKTKTYIENNTLKLKIEEESRLRLDFEHKINSLVGINR